jgi:hypothetical protein
VQTFLRGVHVVDYTESALREAAAAVVTLAAAEDLPAHGQAVTARFRASELASEPVSQRLREGPTERSEGVR